MNVKEMFDGWGNNEWVATAGSAAVIAGVTWYAKRWFKKRKEVEEVALTQQLGGDQELILKILELYQKSEEAKKKPMPVQGTTPELGLLAKLIAETENKKQPDEEAKEVEALNARLDRMEALLVKVVESFSEGSKKVLSDKLSDGSASGTKETTVDAARQVNESLQSTTDELDPLIRSELDKIRASTNDGVGNEFLARLNVIPALLPKEMSADSIANIRETILFAMMCRNRLLGRTIFIPRDKAYDFLVEAQKNVMFLLKEDGFYTPQLEHAFSRCFSFLNDESNFKTGAILQKRA